LVTEITDNSKRLLPGQIFYPLNPPTFNYPMDEEAWTALIRGNTTYYCPAPPSKTMGSSLDYLRNNPENRRFLTHGRKSYGKRSSLSIFVLLKRPTCEKNLNQDPGNPQILYPSNRKT
jgi:hypothetical protein